MRFRYYVMLLAANAAGTTLASAGEVNVRWTGEAGGNSGDVQKSRFPNLAALLRRVEVRVKPGDPSQRAGGQTSCPQGHANLTAQQSHQSRSDDRRHREIGVDVRVNSKWYRVSRQRHAFVDVLVGTGAGSANQPIETPVRKQEPVIQKPGAIQKPNYVGGQLRPIQR